MLTKVCTYTGKVLICLIDNQSDTASFKAERLPDTQNARLEYDPVRGTSTIVSTLEWDEPVVIETADNPAVQTQRVVIRSVGAASEPMASGQFTLVFDGQATPVMSLAMVAACPADLTHGAIAGVPGYGTPDGVIDNDDFFSYLTKFSAGNVTVADLTHGAVPGQAGYGIPNAFISNDDFFYYLAQYRLGC